MALGYPTSENVFRLKGQRSTLGLGLTAIRRGFELYECPLVNWYDSASLTRVRCHEGSQINAQCSAHTALPCFQHWIPMTMLDVSRASLSEATWKDGTVFQTHLSRNWPAAVVKDGTVSKTYDRDSSSNVRLVLADRNWGPPIKWRTRKSKQQWILH